MTWTACQSSFANTPFEGNFMGSLFNISVTLGEHSYVICICVCLCVLLSIFISINIRRICDVLSHFMPN